MAPGDFCATQLCAWLPSDADGSLWSSSDPVLLKPQADNSKMQVCSSIRVLSSPPVAPGAGQAWDEVQPRVPHMSKSSEVSLRDSESCCANSVMPGRMKHTWMYLGFTLFRFGFLLVGS